MLLQRQKIDCIIIVINMYLHKNGLFFGGKIMIYKYKTKGTCSQLIEIETNDDKTIKDVRFLGGCNGNLQGISKLVRGQKIDDVISKLEGIKCGFRQTSCPDQLAQALKQIKESI